LEIKVTAEFAKTLHNGDEVRVKKTNQICKVLTVKTHGKIVVLEVLTPQNTSRQVTHVEVA